MSDRQKSCADRWWDQKESTFDDLRKLWESYGNGEESHEELGSLHEYGLSFDYVAPETFDDQEHGYFRYQLSWGGPSDEIRYYVDPEDCEIAPYDCGPWRTTYVFMDWFDGCERELPQADHQLALALFGWFQEIGAVEHYDR